MGSSDRNANNRRNLRLLCRSTPGFGVLCGFLLLAGVAHGQGRPAEEEIRAVLNDQVVAWNRGDVDGYMKGYWDSDSTEFVSGGTITRGYAKVLARYKKSYNTPQKMGKLLFRELTVRLLSPSAGIATGIWELKRASDKPWGRFTLVLEKKTEGWRITHDHTSSAQ